MKILGIRRYGILDAGYDTVPRVLKGQWQRRRFIRNRDSNGNLYVRYLNWNGDAWNWNYNWLDNDWNDDNPAALLEILFISPLLFLGGVLFN